VSETTFDQSASRIRPIELGNHRFDFEVLEDEDIGRGHDAAVTWWMYVLRPFAILVIAARTLRRRFDPSRQHAKECCRGRSARS
jgi:hypothetical protein